MAWPLTRLTTYNPGSKVKSVDLNAIQDALIKLGTQTIMVPGCAFVVTDTAFPVTYSIIGVGAGEVATKVAGSAYDFVAPIEGLPTNATILNARFYSKDHATGTHKWEFHVVKASIYDTGTTEPIAFILTSGAGTNQTTTFTGLNISGLGTGVKAFLRGRISGAGTQICRLYGAEVDIYVP